MDKTKISPRDCQWRHNLVVMSFTFIWVAPETLINLKSTHFMSTDKISAQIAKILKSM